MRVTWLSNLVTTINHDQPVRRLEHSETETQLTYTSRSREQREFTPGLYAGAAYVKNMWLGFLLRLAVAIHHTTSVVCCIVSRVIPHTPGTRVQGGSIYSAQFCLRRELPHNAQAKALRGSWGGLFCICMESGNLSWL